METRLQPREAAQLSGISGPRTVQEAGRTLVIRGISSGEGQTGKDLQRPGLLTLLEPANSGKVQGVIIYTLDRLYRPENGGDEWRVFEILQRFEDAGVEVAWVDPTIPAKGPLSAIFTFLDAWRAGRERRSMVERTTRGRLEKARRGKVVSGAAAPYGYIYDSEVSVLIINEEQAKVIRLIFHIFTFRSDCPQ